MKKLLVFGWLVLGVALVIVQVLPRILPPRCPNCFQ
jgi:hypothetical protein